MHSKSGKVRPSLPRFTREFSKGSELDGAELLQSANRSLRTSPENASNLRLLPDDAV